VDFVHKLSHCALFHLIVQPTQFLLRSSRIKIKHQDNIKDSGKDPTAKQQEWKHWKAVARVNVNGSAFEHSFKLLERVHARGCHGPTGGP
jgi:hypothetical protein